MAKIGKGQSCSFNVAYIDPPWPYKSKRAGGNLKSGAAQKYECLTLEEICALPIRELMRRDSAVFLWLPSPLKRYFHVVFEAWELEYKATVYWHKTGRRGMGWWFRGQVEEMYLGIYGKVKAFRLQEANLIPHKVLAHSHKPDAFRELIERATNNMPERKCIELFATEAVTGWTALGMAMDGRDINDSLKDFL